MDDAVSLVCSALEQEVVTLKKQASMQGERLQLLDQELRQTHVALDVEKRQYEEAMEWHSERVKTLERRNELLEEHLHGVLFEAQPAAIEPSVDVSTQTTNSSVVWMKGDPYEFTPLTKRPSKRPTVGERTQRRSKRTKP